MAKEKDIFDFLDNATSKTDGLRIELPNYSFYHSPFDEDTPDDRFIGRARLKRKLESLFSYNNSNSGAYLITGYRGMGKSSLIREVLFSMTNRRKQRILQAVTSIFVLAILFYLLANFFPYVNKASSYIFSGPLFLIIFLVVCKLGLELVNTKPEKRYANLISTITLWRLSLQHIFTNSRSWEKHRVYVVKLFIAWMWYCIISVWVIRSSYDEMSGFYLFAYTFFVFLALSYIVFYTYSLVRYIKNKKGRFWTLKSVKSVIAFGKSYLNNSTLTTVQINLNLENLRELDVMQLLSREIYKKFQAFRKSNLLMGIKRLIHGLFVVMLFIVLKELMNGTVISDLRSEARYDLVLESQFEYYPDESHLSYYDIAGKTLVQILNDIDQSIQSVFSRLLTLYPIRKPQQNPKPLIDYLILVLFLGFTFLYKAMSLMFSNNSLSSTYRSNGVLKRLKYLNERIDSILVKTSYTEPKISTPLFSGLSLSTGRLFSSQKFSPIATAREIEIELIDILKEINDLSQKFAGPQLVVVFDEIDKIEPQFRVAEDTKTTNGSEESNSSGSSDHLRARQEIVFSLLSNLKHLLTTAKARFVFIAGREMFDAAQADVSDRNFFVKSIFCHTINVDSFMSDKTISSYPTLIRTTEAYVCHFLPIRKKLKGENDSSDILTLRAYNEYLKKEYPTCEKYRLWSPKKVYEGAQGELKIFMEKCITPAHSRRHVIPEAIRKELFTMNIRSNKASKVLIDFESVDRHMDRIRNIEQISQSLGFSTLVTDYARYKRYKRIREYIILSLRHFIVYLVYRSNGSPKKIANILEEYIRPMEEDDDDKYLTVAANKVNRALHFGFYDLYAFSLINYLVNPLQLLVTASIKDYGDKIMVASSFLLDHIFKHHRSGFSWRDLESMPELLDVNKSPELRDVLQRFLSHLSKIHLKKMQNGLYDFTFTQKIVDEISYLCKVNTYESAALNFTLDESLSMKRYYYHRLHALKSGNHTSSKADEVALTSTIARISIILADIHFNDEEYHDCIFLYSEVCSRLNTALTEKYLDEGQYLQYIRALLKLAIVYEKIKNYDQALITYNIISKVVKRHSAGWRGNMSASLELQLPLLSQHILARLHLIEKAQTNGLSLLHIHEAIAEYNGLIKMKDNNWRMADFIRKLANILYFKNASPYIQNTIPQSSLENMVYSIPLNCAPCKLYSDNILNTIIKKDKGVDLCDSGCIDFKATLSEIEHFVDSCNEWEDSSWIDQTKEIARNLKLLSNCCLGCPSSIIYDYPGFCQFLGNQDPEKQNPTDEIKLIVGIVSNPLYERNKFDLFLMMAYLSAVLYRAIGSHRDEYYLYVNIMFTLSKHRMSMSDNMVYSTLLVKVEQCIVVRAIKCLYRGYSHIHRAEIDRDKACFVANSQLDIYNINLDNLTLNYDLREIMIHKASLDLRLAVFNIQTKLCCNDINKLSSCALLSKLRMSEFMIDRYNSVSLITNRILEMDLDSNYNYNIFQVLGLDSWFNTTYLGNNMDAEYKSYIKARNSFLRELFSADNGWYALFVGTYEQYKSSIVNRLVKDEVYVRPDDVALVSKRGLVSEEAYSSFIQKLVSGIGTEELDARENVTNLIIAIFEYCMFDSIFSLDSVIKHIMIKGISFKYQYSLLANLHYHMGVWCHYLKSYIKFLDNNNDIELCRTRRGAIAGKLKHLFSSPEAITLSPMYYYEVALDYYYKAYRAHQGGESYKDLSHELIFLNDDLDSDITHFAVGFERYMLNTSLLRSRVRYLHKMNRRSYVYKSEPYDVFRS